MRLARSLSAACLFLTALLPAQEAIRHRFVATDESGQQEIGRASCRERV